jgi:hypothetical protein
VNAVAGLVCRRATRADLARLVELLADDELGRSREATGDDDPAYERAYTAIDADRNQLLLVGELEARLIAMLQLTFVRDLSRRGAWQLVALVAAAIVAAAVPFTLPAQTRLPQPKPITRTWNCTNGRIVLVNYHPRRLLEPAWLTYLGNRIEVTRKRVDSGIAATSADGKVNWHEKGNLAELEFAGLLDQPLHCELKSGK